MSRKRPAIRVAVGTPREPFAPAIRVWVDKNDVYVADRQMGHVMKLSIHERDSVMQYTKESGITVPELGGGRRTARFDPPMELPTPGWFCGALILVPRLDDSYDKPPYDKRDVTDVDWIDPPGVGNAIWLYVLITSTDARPDEAINDLKAFVTEPLKLTDGRKVWLAVNERPLEPDYLERLLKIRDDDENVIETNRWLPDGSLNRVHLTFYETGGHVNGVPAFVQIVGTSRNIRHPDDPG
jgi:hypothetical protein